MTAPLTILFVFLMMAAGVLFYRATMSKGAYARHQAKAIRWRIQFRLRPGPGFASLAELVIRWSRLSAYFHGKRARPALPWWARLAAVFVPRFPVRVTDFAIRYGRAQYGRRLYGRIEDPILVVAPPRMFKTAWLADQILNHCGPILATTTRADLFTLTAGARLRGNPGGPIEVFNPLGIGGIASTFSWPIVQGCADAATAIRIADALSGELGEGDMREWKQIGATALAAMLHAADLGSCDIGDVLAWANLHGHAQALEILARHPAAEYALMASLTEAFAETRAGSSIRMMIKQALAWAAVPALRASVRPEPGRSFDVGGFIRARGSLYLIAPGGDESPIAPLFRAMCSDFHYKARLEASMLPGGKLDPPFRFFLDEVTQIVPVPLDVWLADASGWGIPITSVVHDWGQLEARWGSAGASTIWATTVKMIMPGVQNAETLEVISRLSGSVSISKGEDSKDVPVVPAALARQLPDMRALVLRTNLSPAVVKVRPVWKRLDQRLGRAATVPLLTPALPAGAAAPVPAPAAAGAPALPKLTFGEDHD